MSRFRAALVAFVALFSLIAAGCDWPMYAFGPEHTGNNPLETKISATTVSGLHEVWRRPLIPLTTGGSTPPVEVGGVLYAAAAGNEYTVQALDAAGTQNCSGVPLECTPLWTFATDGAASALGVADADATTATHNVVVVGIWTTEVEVFDAAGVNGCSGMPKVCAPLWKATGVTGQNIEVAGGYVYAPRSDHSIAVFDLAGVNGCAGLPKMCSPLWTVPGDTAAISHGVLYTTHNPPNTSEFDVLAFDAAGISGCSGSPKTCTPLWTGKGPSDILFNSFTRPTVANGRVFVGTEFKTGGFAAGGLVGFDAAGVTGCSGSPKVCMPTWRAPTSAVDYPPAIAGNTLFVTNWRWVNQTLSPQMLAFDIGACTNTNPQSLCSPKWSADISAVPQGYAVANGLLYVSTSFDKRLAAYDANGTLNCTGVPTQCTPLWSVTTNPGAIPTGPVIANGTLYFGTYGEDGLYAYKP